MEGVFEQVDLMNYLDESKDSDDMKAVIMKRVVNEIVALERKRNKTEKDDYVIISDILFLDYLDNNSFFKSILLWLFFWLDKSLFVEDLNSLIKEKGSVLKCIRTIRNNEDDTFIHGFKKD